jgi:hypothetical protein
MTGQRGQACVYAETAFERITGNGWVAMAFTGISFCHPARRGMIWEFTRRFHSVYFIVPVVLDKEQSPAQAQIVHAMNAR